MIMVKPLQYSEMAVLPGGVLISGHRLFSLSKVLGSGQLDRLTVFY